MEKTKEYWSIHKEVYNNELNELDVDIIQKISNSPLGHEARLFNNRVDKEIERRVKVTVS